MKKLILYSIALVVGVNICYAQKGRQGCTSATTPSGSPKGFDMRNFWAA